MPSLNNDFRLNRYVVEYMENPERFHAYRHLQVVYLPTCNHIH